MTTYLFVTSPDYEPERVCIDNVWWSCPEDAKDGETALVYVTGQGITYEWDLVSDSRPCREKKWPYECDVQYARTFDPPIAMKEIRAAITREEWRRPYGNFQGIVDGVGIPELAARRLRAMRGRGPLVSH